MMLRNNDDIKDWISEGGSFQVRNGDYFGTGTIEQGSVLFEQEW